MYDHPLRKNGLIKWATAKEWRQEGSKLFHVPGVDVLSKTEQDFLYIMEFTKTTFVDYGAVISEIDYESEPCKELYPELN